MWSKPFVVISKWHIPVAIISSHTVYPLVDMDELKQLQKIPGTGIPYGFLPQTNRYKVNYEHRDKIDGYECEYGYIYWG